MATFKNESIYFGRNRQIRLGNIIIIIIIQYAVWRQVQSLFQNDSSTWCDPKPPLSNESILSCP